MPEAVASDEFLTKRELARLCRRSERTIDRLFEEGDAPPVTKLSTRRIIFPATSAREWLAGRTTGHRKCGLTVRSRKAAPPG
jgi:predicted DNA-binding transcriptional regulator AlpA